ncbi:hypothetical protein [Mesorhizobium sp. M5C.F.Cr.IN.023.01.1.1]|uniref:hypothetical protein n=2 Tax=unclassified Mesorhizobium TaxID=325217 RepID=UPI0013E29D38|nr:hypothetical protein [Mesorhizobium sp. M5C.F.Cr.IN.023.01.1.1]
MTNQANNCPKGTMRKLGRISILANIPLRALLAVVFLVMSALQPGLFATANATGFHSDAGMNLPAEDHEMSGHDHAAAADDSDMSEHDHGTKNSSEKSCEVHCAPAHAVPVDCPDLERVVSRCFAAVVAEASAGGEYTAHIRPPRHLG